MATIPPVNIPRAREAYECLVDEDRRLKSVAGTLAAKTMSCDLAQVGQQHFEQSGLRVAIT